MAALLASPMWTSLSVYGAGVGHVSAGPPSVEEGGGVAAELAAADDWFVGESTDNSVSSCVDSTSHHF